MFCIAYEFRIKPGQDEIFKTSWAAWTDAIHRVRGSLGSRLHTTMNEGVYVGYAQWPSREIYQTPPDESHFTADELRARDAMNAAIASANVMHMMTVIDDRLRAS